MSEYGCRNCIYALNTSYDDVERYQCRRNPPYITSRGFTQWPQVQPDDWCGEFGKRPAELQELQGLMKPFHEAKRTSNHE